MPPLTLVPTPGKGWGVLAGADIPSGAFIIEYVGEIIDEAVSA
jgi:SET domain-containing protein